MEGLESIDVCVSELSNKSCLFDIVFYFILENAKFFYLFQKERKERKEKRKKKEKEKGIPKLKDAKITKYTTRNREMSRAIIS
mgnify:FL=1